MPVREDLLGSAPPAYMRRTVPHDGAPYLSTPRAAEEAIREWIAMDDARDTPKYGHEEGQDPDAISPDNEHEGIHPLPQDEALETTAGFRPHMTAMVVHLPGHPVGTLWIYDDTFQGTRFMEGATPLQRAVVKAILLRAVKDLDRREEMDG